MKSARPAHGHAFMELVLVKSGSGLHRTYFGSSRISPGAVRLVRPGQWHCYDQPKELLVWNVYIAPGTLAGELTALRANPFVAPLVTGSTAASRAKVAAGAQRRTADRMRSPRPGRGLPGIEVTRIEQHLQALGSRPTSSTADSLARLGHLLVVLSHVMPTVARLQDEQLRSVHPAVTAATDLMHAHPEEQWTLRSLAQLVHTSEHYLCRCFTRELGISPLRYLDRHRLELAAQLLLESDLPISVISTRVGIRDPSYMARRFRAAHGMAPSQYRSTLDSVDHMKLP